MCKRTHFKNIHGPYRPSDSILQAAYLSNALHTFDKIEQRNSIFSFEGQLCRCS